MEPTETKATANQKVFITLDAYTKLVTEYQRVTREIEKGRAGGADVGYLVMRRQAFEFVFNTTGLPIER
jgi:hypothetical protein